MQNLELQCSPKTFRRLQDDEEYRNEMTKQLLGSRPATDFIPNIIVSEIPDTQTEREENVECNFTVQPVLPTTTKTKEKKPKSKSKSRNSTTKRRRRRAFTDFVLDSEETGSTLRPDPNAELSPEESFKLFQQRKDKRQKRRCTAEDKLLMKLDIIRVERAKFHANMLQRLEDKEKVEKQRNKLLKKIADSLDPFLDDFISESEQEDEE